jgi:oxalate decarboxylase/phosphoglucose isomerase-like protein (cupin superfamily)
MDSKAIKIGKTQLRAKSAYERFMIGEGVPVIGGFGVNAVRDIPTAPWRRLGCDGAYFNFFGSDGFTGMYAGKIALGGATSPERHLYEKVIYILQGEGVAEFQQRDRVPQNLLWQAGSLFSPPLNTLHRLINHSDQPALFLAVTTAPMALDHYRNEEFIFHSDFVFSDRYDGAADYFTPSDGRYVAMNHRQWMHQANFIPDVREIRRGGQAGKRGRIKITRFEIANNSLIGQLVEWPVGRYRKAHCRGGGVSLVILRSSGYSLMWPNDLGTQPYKNGLGDQVVRLDWAPGSIFSPPPNWFQQHFNTGAEPAQTLAFYCGSRKFPMTRGMERANAVRHSAAKQAGKLLEFDGDDPSIRRMYEDELARKGISPDMNFEVAANDD